MDSVSRIGLQGMQEGLRQVEQSAQAIAESFTPESGEGPAAAILDMQSGSRQVQASATVVQTGAELQKYILDVMA